ncbi:MAG: hypothetical protein GXY83_22725 [Rhodopirellula sp.]|nr:hypothetical protein [Rhodopirellula sp.]
MLKTSKCDLPAAGGVAGILPYRVPYQHMRLWLRLLLTVVVVAAIGLGAWVSANWNLLYRQWICYQVGAATSYEEAKAGFRWFETGPDREARIDELVRKWGTGNQQFDLFLARYVGETDSSEALRERFSLEFGWRDELLDGWAHYWTWQAQPDPDREIASIRTYLDTLALADPPRAIPWREVLDLQAIFWLTGHSDLARRLKPSNWSARYRQWRQRQTSPMPTVPRATAPLND